MLVVALAGRLVHHGLVAVRVERLAGRVDALEPLLLEGAEQRGEDRLDLGGAVADGGVAGVEHGQQVLDQALGGARPTWSACCFIIRLR